MEERVILQNWFSLKSSVHDCGKILYYHMVNLLHYNIARLLHSDDNDMGCEIHYTRILMQYELGSGTTTKKILINEWEYGKGKTRHTRILTNV